MNEEFNGQIGFYAKDIAILVLPIKITMSNVVSPVCVDWYKRYSISNGSFGQVNLFSIIFAFLHCGTL